MVRFLVVFFVCCALPSGAQETSPVPLPPELREEGPLAQAIVARVQLRPRLLLISPTTEAEWVEGETVKVAWETVGPIEYVRAFVYGENTELGGRSRGSFKHEILADSPNRGVAEWEVEWIDGWDMTLRLVGLDEHYNIVTETERPLRFRPRALEGLEGTFIAIIKSRQRLYYYQQDQLEWISIVSTARSPYYTPTMQPGSYDRRRGAMGKVFNKSPKAWSNEYEVWMPYWMAVTSSGSHGIHATSSNLYRYLGGPASHGCIRQHRSDARTLYNKVSLGTAVYIFN
jgi:hypothetical protein